MFDIRHAIGPVIILVFAACHSNNRPAVTPADSLSTAPAAAAADSSSIPAGAGSSSIPAGAGSSSTPGAGNSSSIPAGNMAIIFFGNSLTAGYGLEPGQSFPALIAHRLDSLHKPYKIIQSGVSGETSSEGLTRVSWVLSRNPVDIFVLELGGNDGLRGIPPTNTRDNLQGIIDTVRKKYPAAKIVLAGMQIPPNMGETYTKTFRDLFPALAKKNNLTLIPFLLEGVGGVPALNQGDGIHPNAAGEKIVAETVWKTLKPLL